VTLTSSLAGSSRPGWLEELPSDWSEVHLRWLAQLYAGGTPDKSKEEYWSDGTIPWVNSGSVNQGLVTEASAFITQAGYDGSSARWVPEGALVMALAGQGKTKGMVAQMGMAATCNQSMAAIVPGGVNARFLFYWLTANYRRIRSGASDDLRDGLNLQMLGDIPCPVPKSTTQQKRIANFLDEKTARIDALIAEKEDLLVRLGDYQHSYASRLMTLGRGRSSMLKSTSFPEIGEVPTHWDVKRLKFLGEVRSGIAKGKDHAEKQTVMLPYLRVANVQDGYVDLNEVLEIEVGMKEVDRYLLKRGDVLMNEGGDNDKLGRGTVWEGQIEPCVHQNHVFAVRLNDVELAEWVARFTSTAAARSYFFLRSKQSTNLASINQSNVRELPVPMPPRAERLELLAELRRSSKATSDLSVHVSEHIDRLREYRSSLISAAVTGQLDISSYKEAA
jgi:type I restriction enzyme S subunit